MSAATRPPDDPAGADPKALPPPIVFVGGTGRSGTHVLAELLGRHPAFALVPVESRFHVNPGGFPDLLAGEVSPRQFLRKLKRFWWRRIPAGEPVPALLPSVPMGRQTRGLYKVLEEADFRTAVAGFETRADDEPLERSCRRLFLDLLWPLAERAGKPGLVEMSTHTVAQAAHLAKLFPESKLVHIVRDGRDSGSSKVGKRQKPTHPRDVAEGVDWWLGRLERAERSIAEAPPGYVLTLSLDELAVGDREGAYAELRTFLGIADARPMRRFFERQMNAGNASRGRWRAGLSEAQQRAVTERYERVLGELEHRGRPSGPVLRQVLRNLG